MKVIRKVEYCVLLILLSPICGCLEEIDLDGSTLKGKCVVDRESSSITYTSPDGGVEVGQLYDDCEYFPKSDINKNNLIEISYDGIVKISPIYMLFDDVSSTPENVPIITWPTGGQSGYNLVQEGEIGGENQIAMRIDKATSYSGPWKEIGSIDSGAKAIFSVLQWPPEDSTGSLSVKFSKAVSFQDGSKLELEFSAVLETYWSSGLDIELRYPENGD